MYRMKQMAAVLRKEELDIKYHCYYSQTESLAYIPKRTQLNDILKTDQGQSSDMPVVIQVERDHHTFFWAKVAEEALHHLSS